METLSISPNLLLQVGLRTYFFDRGHSARYARRMPTGHDARRERHNLERQNRILAAAVDLLEEGPAGTEIPVKHMQNGPASPRQGFGVK
ncbi:hypothetical protein ACFO9E_06190 [Streptomyces maoxianensis]|uniref:Uncharacterized protein n=1 Tax=Streptomyces maoxianensis TaxID=1459942 RepID=A0ABV9G462_9ACTN